MRRAAGVSMIVALTAAALSGIGVAGAQDASPQPDAGPSAVDAEVHLNEIQVVGSHNSYHEVPPPAETVIRQDFLGPADDLLQYRHEPLPAQFQSQKVRQIELDIFLDSAGGTYANPLLRAVAGGGPYDPAMNQPGIKVMHVQDVDYHTTCLTLKACLRQVDSWSDANPTHAPIAIMLELKDDLVPVDDFPFVVPEPFDTPAAMDTLDAEIRSVMDPEDIITPDDVRGARSTLDEAVTTDGWPTLGESRGKVMFLMDNGGSYRDAYRTGAPTLEGRPMFTNANPGDPDAGFVKRNDSSQVSEIQDLVRDGYVVRTRSDAETVEARENDVAKRDDAFASGAQWVSTDYPVRGLAVGFETDFVVEIPGGTVARCNPVNGPASCVSAEIDTIFTPPGPPVLPPTGPPPTDPPASDLPDPSNQPDNTAAPAVPVTGRPNFTG